LWGGVGGGGRGYGALNDFEHAIDVSDHVVIPEAQDAIALAFEKSGTLRIGGGHFGMLPAINLDDESSVVTGKVHDVGPQPNLPSEMRARNGQTMPQMPPEFLLCLGWRCAHRAGSGMIE
jgi:hypothetical protein